MCGDRWLCEIADWIKKKSDRICEIEQNHPPGLGSATRPSSVSHRLQSIIPRDQQLYSQRSSGMHGLLPLQGKPTKNISNQSLSRSQGLDGLCVCALIDQD